MARRFPRRFRSRPDALLTLPILAALATTVTLGVAPATVAAPDSAARSLPAERTVKDPKDPTTDWDLRKVTMRAGIEDDEPAALHFVFAHTPGADDSLAVLWNLDKDKKPDLRMYTVGGGIVVEKVNGWNQGGKTITDKECVSYVAADGGANRVTVLFDPGCLGKSTRFQINAVSYTQVNGLSNADYLPAKRKWTKAVDSIVAAPSA